MKKGVSVIVCCYNSESKLPTTLSYLSAQQLEQIFLEIIIVDNNSTDNTFSLAEAYWEANGKNNVPLRVIKEPRPGLSYARHTGVKNANYDLLVFCDDDNWLDKEYCQRAYDIMSNNYSIGVLGGLNTAVGEIKLPDWFKQVEQSYACGPQNAVDGEVERMYITGAGMVLRKDLFEIFPQIQFESQLTDRKGEELSSGGDSEICFIAVLLGFKLFYSSELKLFHYMESKRLQWKYYIAMSLGHAESSYKLNYYFNESKKSNWLSELFRILKPIMGKRVLVLIRDYFYVKNNIAPGERVHHMVLFKQILAHLSFYKDYKRFIDNIDSLKVRIKNYKNSYLVNG